MFFICFIHTFCIKTLLYTFICVNFIIHVLSCNELQKFFPTFSEFKTNMYVRFEQYCEDHARNMPLNGLNNPFSSTDST